MTNIEDAKRDNQDPEECLRPIALEAEAFLLSQKWCEKIDSGFVERAWANVLGVFYFRFKPSHGVPPDVWIVVGDIPPAYFDTRHCKTGEDALWSYISRMRDWVKAVRKGRSTAKLIPVLARDSYEPVNATTEIVDGLASRLKFIEKHML